MSEEPFETATVPNDLTAMQDRLASCRSEIQRLTGLKRRRWINGCRGGIELKTLVPWLRFRAAIVDTFWRTFSLVVGSSCMVAVVFIVTRETAFQFPVVLLAGVTALSMITLLVFWPPDTILDQRRLVLSQSVASADNEHQNLCSQLEVLYRRHDSVQQRLSMMIPGPSSAANALATDSSDADLLTGVANSLEIPSDSETPS
ncbi:MAG: hypothetical protein CMJ65_06485 [Planctomycetaceae bacterium]|nr:hypothetical protein [Planctomycetaceae bacterium]MDP7276789.1 hypothetical protein [Planctomycetaceae bacterium]